jgi:hypothetical protein
MIMPIRRLGTAYTALKERIVVSVPAPAIIGKAKGTIDPVPVFGSCLKSVIPNIISIAMINITIAPATANDPTSNPKSPKIEFPRNRKRIIKAPAIKVALPEWILPSFFLRSMTIGTDPKMSMTENRMRDTENISLALNIVFILIID